MKTTADIFDPVRETTPLYDALTLIAENPKGRAEADLRLKSLIQQNPEIIEDFRLAEVEDTADNIPELMLIDFDELHDNDHLNLVGITLAHAIEEDLGLTELLKAMSNHGETTDLFHREGLLKWVAARENDKPELESRYSGFLLKMGVGHDVFQVIKEAIEMANKNQVKTFVDIDEERPLFNADEFRELIAHADRISSNRETNRQ